MSQLSESNIISSGFLPLKKVFTQYNSISILVVNRYVNN